MSSELGQVTHAYEVQQLSAGKASDTCLYVKCANPAESEVKFLVKVR